MSDPDSILIVKTGALGDVLRTTAILPGLLQRHPRARVTWIVAPDAMELLEGRAGVREVLALDAERPGGVVEALAGRRFELVVSLDEEAACCRIAGAVEAGRLVGAFLGPDGEPTYTVDARDWFDMSLISRLGKERADELKTENRRTHPELMAAMLGIAEGRPELELTAAAEALADRHWAEGGLAGAPLVVGLNTGSGSRWPSKQVDEARTVATAREIAEGSGEEVVFLVLGGPEEGARNERILEGLRMAGLGAASGGTENSLIEFAALVNRCDLVLTSDSYCLHVAVARRTPCVAFFAPTSAAEIELYGLGAKVASTAPDACSYRADADNSTITPARLAEAALQVLAQPSEGVN